LIDGGLFLRKDATGIGSYGRTLARTLTRLGYDLGLLFDKKARWTRENGEYALAAQVFGSSPVLPGRLEYYLERVSEQLRSRVGLGSRLVARALQTRGIDFTAQDPPLPAFDHAFNVSDLTDKAQQRFQRSGRLVPLDRVGECDFVHWTRPVPIRMRGVPNLYTIHDLVPLKFPYFVLDRNGLATRIHRALAASADHIITVSERSRADIVELLGVDEARVSVTYQPVPAMPELRREDAENIVQSVFNLEPGRYALFLGAVEPKKNIKRLLEAFGIAGTGLQLVLAGPAGWLNEEELELVEQLRGSSPLMLSERLAGPGGRSFVQTNRPFVRWLGYLPRRHVAALMRCARFFVFPSVYEGFGLPVLEAMQAGVPVLTSHGGSLPEVAGDAALLVDPLDVGAIARGIQQLARDQDLRDELARRGPPQARRFSDEACAQRLAEAYRRIGLPVPAGPAPG